VVLLDNGELRVAEYDWLTAADEVLNAAEEETGYRLDDAELVTDAE
jgi:hypothetical protein